MAAQAAGDVAVAGDELGEAVHHHGGAMLDGPHHRGRSHGGVHHEVDASRRQHGRHRGQVHQTEKRIGDGLDEHGARRRAQAAQDGRGIGGVHKGGLDAEPPAVGGKIGRRGPIEIARGHHVITGGEKPEQPGGGGAHAGGAGHRRLGSLE
jgi:hypothetical protein